jgi:hypothetical protein
MAPNLAVVRPRTPDEKFAEHLSALDDDRLGCKAERKHRMPRLKPGNLPGALDVRRRAGGVYQITAECSECGIPGTLTTGKGGTLTGQEQWEYDYSAVPGYLAPHGTGRTRLHEYRMELGRRIAPDIRQLAAASAAERSAAKRSAAAAKAARTPKRPRPSNTHGHSPAKQRRAREGEDRVSREWNQRHRGGTS